MSIIRMRSLFQKSNIISLFFPLPPSIDLGIIWAWATRERTMNMMIKLVLWDTGKCEPRHSVEEV